MALTDSIVAYWTMDESSGANRLDSTGNSRTATNFGTVTAGTGIISNGDSAWSDTNYLSVADNDVFDATGAFSIQVWIRSTAWSGASMTLLSK